MLSLTQAETHIDIEIRVKALNIGDNRPTSLDYTVASGMVA